jgi:putative oxidoreductase
MRKIMSTSNDYGVLVSRLALGAVMFPHGAQKALGWFGGYGFAGTVKFMTENLHIPTPFVYLAIAAEFLGSLGLIVGLLGRSPPSGSPRSWSSRSPWCISRTECS